MRILIIYREIWMAVCMSISESHSRCLIIGKLLDSKKAKACEWLTSTSQWSNGQMIHRGLSRT